MTKIMVTLYVECVEPEKYERLLFYQAVIRFSKARVDNLVRQIRHLMSSFVLSFLHGESANIDVSVSDYTIGGE